MPGLSRKPAAAIALLFFVLFLVFRAPRPTRSSVSQYRQAYLPRWSTQSWFACPSNRSNPWGVQPPPTIEPRWINELWKELSNIYDANPPHPDKLDKPSPGDGPSKEVLRELVKLNERDAQASRKAHAEVLNRLPGYPAGRFHGRGVVMLAGGRYAEFAATSLGVLRALGSTLPVEVWVKDEGEEQAGWCDELLAEGMACRRLADYVDMDNKKLRNPYSWKIMTMLFSSFREILFLDADDIPIRNMDEVFESDVYRTNGAVLWPDYWKHTGSDWLSYVTGLTEGKSEAMWEEQSVESGQILWNKETHWKVSRDLSHS